MTTFFSVSVNRRPWTTWLSWVGRDHGRETRKSSGRYRYALSDDSPVLVIYTWSKDHGAIVSIARSPRFQKKVKECLSWLTRRKITLLSVNIIRKNHNNKLKYKTGNWSFVLNLQNQTKLKLATSSTHCKHFCERINKEYGLYGLSTL